MINAQKRKLYEFLGCLYHGDTCQQFREVTSLGGDTQAERYEKIMARLQQLTGLGYTVEVVWECQFDRDNLPHHPELKHPIVQSGPPKTRDNSTVVEPSPCFSIIRSVREKRFNITT